MTHRIMIVEDEPLNVQLLQIYIREAGYEIAGVYAEGRSVIKAVREDPPDLILMDISILGDLDGIETSELILAETQLPIIFVTAHTDAPTLQRASDVSPYGYLVKPINVQMLKTSLSVAISKFETDRKIQSQADILENSLNEIYTFDGASLAILNANAAARENLGYELEELKLKSLDQIFLDLDQAVLSGIANREVSAGAKPQAQVLETRMARADGTSYIAEVHIHAHQMHAHSVRVALVVDITERKQAEVQRQQYESGLKRTLLKEQILSKVSNASLNLNDLTSLWAIVHESLAQLIDVSNLVIGILDEKNHCLRFDYIVEEKDKGALEPIPLDSPDSLAIRVIQSGSSLLLGAQGITEALSQNKARVYGETPTFWLGVPIGGEQPAMGLLMLQSYEEVQGLTADDMAFLETLTDLMAQAMENQRQTLALAQSEQRFKCISESAQDAICMITPSGDLSFMNAAGLKMFGYSEAELLHKPIHDFIMPERYRPQHTAAFEQFQRTGQGAAVGKTVELNAKNARGEEFPIEISLSSVELEDGWNSIAIIRDITERVKAIDNTRRLSGAIEQSDDAIVICDPEMKIQFVNASFCELTGWSESDVFGKPWTSLIDPELFHPVAESIQAAIQDERSWKHRWTARRHDGSSYDEEVRIAPILEEHSLKNIVIIKRDISEEILRDRELRQAQKLESIGQLAAGIAHEINTPAQYVSDNIQFLDEGFRSLIRLIQAAEKDASVSDSSPSPDSQLETLKGELDYDFLAEEMPLAIEQAAEGIKRVTKIVRAIKAFSHPGDEEKKPVDLNEAILTTVMVARNEWKYVSDLSTELDETLPQVMCFGGEINQVLLNMIVNAAHAIGGTERVKNGEKGAIVVSTSQTDGQVIISPEWFPTITKWEALWNVGIEDIKFEFPDPDTTYIAHHLEKGYNAVYLTNLTQSWLKNISVHNGDSGILADVCSHITIDGGVYTGKLSHYTIMFGDVTGMLAKNVEVNGPCRHSLSFNTGARACVFTQCQVTVAPSLDQHGGANHQNLFDDIKLVETTPGRTFFYKGGDGYWSPTHGAFSTFWNIEVTFTYDLPEGQVVELEAVPNGPSARLIGIHGNYPMAFSYGPDAYIEGLNKGSLLIPSLYRYQLNKRLTGA